MADRVCDDGARQAVERHCAARDEYDEAPIRVCKLGASDSPPAADVLDDAFDDDVAVAVERGDARRRSRRSSRAPAGADLRDRPARKRGPRRFVAAQACEAFLEMMDGGKKCFSCVLLYAAVAAAAANSLDIDARKNAAASHIVASLQRGGGELDAALTLRQSGVRALARALRAHCGCRRRRSPARRRSMNAVFYAADAKAPPHQGKRGKAEREAETGLRGRCSAVARRRVFARGGGSARAFR